jgi:hypothetical protein
MGRPADLYLMAPWFLLTPTIHVAHGELRSAAISVAMRVAMVGAFYLAGRVGEAECGSGDFCIPLGAFLIAEVGLVAPITIDAVLLARTRQPAPEWDRLPLLSAAFDASGRRLLTLTARF